MSNELIDSGLKVGDLIIKYKGEAFSLMNAQQILTDLLAEESGTSYTITVERADEILDIE